MVLLLAGATPIEVLRTQMRIVALMSPTVVGLCFA
jgi:hypothetical protein